MIFRYKNDYPEMCPPERAQPASGQWLYRTCKFPNNNGVLNPDNFIPVFEESDRPFPPKKECVSKALSFFGSHQDLEKKMQQFPLIGDTIIKVKLDSKCGVLLKAKKGTHYSLWDLYDPELSGAIGDQWEEVIVSE